MITTIHWKKTIVKLQDMQVSWLLAIKMETVDSLAKTLKLRWNF